MSKFVKSINQKWTEVWNTNLVLSSLYKLISNSCFGKTIMKKINEEYKFVTKNSFEKSYNNSDLIDA